MPLHSCLLQTHLGVHFREVVPFLRQVDDLEGTDNNDDTDVDAVLRPQVTSWSTDQVIVCMLGLEHPSDVLQVVRVDLLGAAPGEGHGDDALCDIRQVQLVSLLHFEFRGFLLNQNKTFHRGPNPSPSPPTLSESIFAGQSPQLSSTLADSCLESPNCLTVGVLFAQKPSQSLLCFRRNAASRTFADNKDPRLSAPAI